MFQTYGKLSLEDLFEVAINKSFYCFCLKKFQLGKPIKNVNDQG